MTGLARAGAMEPRAAAAAIRELGVDTEATDPRSL
jgi:hypothetical protein